MSALLYIIFFEFLKHLIGLFERKLYLRVEPERLLPWPCIIKHIFLKKECNQFCLTWKVRGRVMFRTMDIKEVTGVKDHGLIRLKGECSRCLGLGEISDRAWVGILIFDTCSYFSDKLQGTSYKISLGRTHTHTHGARKSPQTSSSCKPNQFQDFWNCHGVTSIHLLGRWFEKKNILIISCLTCDPSKMASSTSDRSSPRLSATICST